MLHDRQKGDSFAIRHAFKLPSFFFYSRLLVSLFRFVPSSTWKIERHSMRNWNEISAMNTLFYLKSQYDIVKMCFSQLRNGFGCHVAVYTALHPPDVHTRRLGESYDQKWDDAKYAGTGTHRFDFIVSTCTNIFVFFVLFFWNCDAQRRRRLQIFCCCRRKSGKNERIPIPWEETTKKKYMWKPATTTTHEFNTHSLFFFGRHDCEIPQA